MICQSGKFVLRNRDIGHAILMLSIYLLVNSRISGACFLNFSLPGLRSGPDNHPSDPTFIPA